MLTSYKVLVCHAASVDSIHIFVKHRISGVCSRDYDDPVRIAIAVSRDLIVGFALPFVEITYPVAVTDVKTRCQSHKIHSRLRAVATDIIQVSHLGHPAGPSIEYTGSAMDCWPVMKNTCKSLMEV